MAEPAQSPHHAPDNNQRARASNSPPAPTSNRIDALLAWARESLNRLEAELLLGAAAGLERTTIIAWPERALSSSERRRFEQLVTRRHAGEPIAYILGQREFRGLPLRVTPATLIPRPETELLVDWALAQFPPSASIRCADLGTGSGAIALTVALERPGWPVMAVEHSSAALAVAQTNRKALSATNVQLIQSNWLAAIAPATLNLVLANPPYVAAQDPHLSRGDPRFEPLEALAAGADGLAAIRDIAAELPHCLVPGGKVAIEHGWNQGPAVRDLLHQAGLSDVHTHHDLARLERFTSAQRER
ncbi:MULTISPECIES: peptide chain release factor N(5)-glutamine methyltransferase [Thiorhodovibrio]|uniref:peptide chain release factor N(5)-glutamine methyltransferase n=1 Tax=Thiorhodovibrio TaxID=61593 RepID=UPI0019120E12|nr:MULTISPECIES: peptide chain release factor N(5)-glutamine methyltransferase [Thiorhodovibrio]MBK5968142.1 protein-(glutamine-N5) methyltransferase, release factor-specific [Thiorhodovibrio winogradskyi]WPL13640.1 Release factor glutamine methyltransferase [Thiorhodovibrio litoralis]